MYWRLNQLGQVPIANSSGFNRTGTFRNGLSFGQADALVNGEDTAILGGSSGIGYSDQQAQAADLTTYSLEAWVKTTSWNGGKIIGLENARTGWGTTFDRHIYMTNNGRIAYGIRSGGVNRVITSTATYRDDVFHHIVATQGPSGMALYVDGVLVGTNAAVTPDAATGYWRVGGGNLAGWENQPASSALIGTFDEVAVYPSALSADQVAAHFAAASG